MNSKYKKVYVYYFSGTGNAKNAAGWIIEEAEKAGIRAQLIDISKTGFSNVTEPVENSLIGFISPTHGFHFPQIMRRFIKHFPKSKNCDVFVSNTRAGLRFGNKVIGGISGVVHYWSSIILGRKGYKITGLLPVDLPSNWISLHPAVSQKGTNVLYEKVEPRVRLFINNLIKGKRSFKALCLRDIVLDIVIAPITLFYTFAGKYFFAKSYIASSKCDNCNLCINACPVKAIKEVQGRVYWTTKCESCMKCMNICPHKAIETAHGFIFLIWVITSIIVGIAVSHLIEHSAPGNWQWIQNSTVQFCIETILIFPLLFMGYRLMHFLLGYTLFESLFVYTSLTKYRFWGRYKMFRRNNRKL